MYEKVYTAMVQQMADILLTMDDERPTASTMHGMPIRQRRMESKNNWEIQN